MTKSIMYFYELSLKKGYAIKKNQILENRYYKPGFILIKFTESVILENFKLIIAL